MIEDHRVIEYHRFEDTQANKHHCECGHMGHDHYHSTTISVDILPGSPSLGTMHTHTNDRGCVVKDCTCAGFVFADPTALFKEE